MQQETWHLLRWRKARSTNEVSHWLDDVTCSSKQLAKARHFQSLFYRPILSRSLWIILDDWQSSPDRNRQVRDRLLKKWNAKTSLVCPVEDVWLYIIFACCCHFDELILSRFRLPPYPLYKNSMKKQAFKLLNLTYFTAIEQLESKLCC